MQMQFMEPDYTQWGVNILGLKKSNKFWNVKIGGVKEIKGTIDILLLFNGRF